MAGNSDGLKKIKEIDLKNHSLFNIIPLNPKGIVEIALLMNREHKTLDQIAEL